MTQSLPTEASDRQPRPVGPALARGFFLVCPACGRGKLFRAFLKVTDRCETCGEELFHHRADDAPPYFTVLIVGHVMVAGVLFLEQALAPPVWMHIALWLPLTLILSLICLPRAKGALVGLQWALRMHGFGAYGKEVATLAPIADISRKKPRTEKGLHG
ncbi:MAG: DUF983 domain-containing protein [Hyphomicrobiaceae bacterium]